MAGDGDGPEWAAESYPEARKPHPCGECSRVIQPGERYERVAGVWDGHFMVQLTCPHCSEARRWLDRVCRGWLYNGVLEDLGDHWGEGYTDLAFGRLLVLARRRWRASRVGTDRVAPEYLADLVSASLARQDALGHLGRDRWAA